MSNLLAALPRHVPQILINRERAQPPPRVSAGFDVELLGDCDGIVHFLCAQLGWPADWASPSADAPPPPPPPPPAYSHCPAEPRTYLFPGAVPPKAPQAPKAKG